MDDSALKALIDCLGAQRSEQIRHLNNWNWVVAIGVAFELIFILWDHWEGFHDWKYSRTHLKIPFPSRPNRIELILEILSVAMVVGGIVGELNVEAKLGDLDSRVQDADNKRVVLLQQQTEHERLLRVQLQGKIVDIFGLRRLSATQSLAIANKLSGLRGARIDVYAVDPGNPFTSTEDSETLARDIVSTLRSAGMNAEGWRMTGCFAGVQASNVFLTAPDSGELHRVALRVISVFRSEILMDPNVEGVKAACLKSSHLEGVKPHRPWPDAAISITIGRKTQPILTRQMLEPSEQKH
jgi:hypothetical protein